MGRDEQEQQHDEKVDQLLDEYAQRRIDRLEFFKRAGVLGIGVAAAGALLAACGGDDTAAPAPEEPAAPPPAPEPEPPPPAPEPEPPPPAPEPEPPPPAPEPVPPPPAEPVTLDYWTWFHITQVPGEEGMDRIKEAFEAANPDVTLNVKVFPFPDYLTALTTAIPAGEGAHVYGLQNGSLIRQYRPFLEVLNDIADERLGAGWEQAYIDTSISLPLRTNNWPEVSEEYWWIPAQVSVLGVQWYWTDIFEQVGVSVPADYNEFKALAQELRAADFIPVAWGAKDKWPNPDYLITYATQYRPNSVEDAELGVISFTDPSIVNALAFMAQTVEDGLYNEGPFGTTAYPEAYIDMFAAQKAATINTGAHNISLGATPGAEEHWRAFLFPHIPDAPVQDWLGDLPSGVPTETGPGSSRPIFDVGYLLAMQKDLDDRTKDAAWRFIEFFAGEEGQTIQSGFAQPSLKSVSISGFENAEFNAMLDWHFAVADHGERREFLFPETREALDTAIEAVVVTGADPETELAFVDDAASEARDAA